MEREFRSGFQRQISDRQSPRLNPVDQPSVGQRNTDLLYMNPSSETPFVDGSSPTVELSSLPKSTASKLNGTYNWSVCLPSPQKTFAPDMDTGLRNRLLASMNVNLNGVELPSGGPCCGQRRFLVFDHCGDQTTLIFSSGIGVPVPNSTSWSQKLPASFDLNKEYVGTKEDTISPPGPFLVGDFHELNGDVQSEMHEDTEELNALLYSENDSDFSEDDEEASTGHSPSTMTSYEERDCSVESGEEVASCEVPPKRQKRSEGVYHVPLYVQTAASMKPGSGSGNDKNIQIADEMSSLSSKKRSRKEKIRETVDILRSIIPTGKGKDAIGVLDEAIHYLKSVKPMANAFGFDVL